MPDIEKESGSTPENRQLLELLIARRVSLLAGLNWGAGSLAVFGQRKRINLIESGRYGLYRVDGNAKRRPRQQKHETGPTKTRKKNYFFFSSLTR